MSLSLRAGFVVCAALAASTVRAEPQTARLSTYATNDQSYFALSLLPATAADPAQRNELVLLVDTSASQAGPIRQSALEALDALLAGLRPADRVQLVAIDGRAVPMSAGFAAP